MDAISTSALDLAESRGATVVRISVVRDYLARPRPADWRKAEAK